MYVHVINRKIISDLENRSSLRVFLYKLYTENTESGLVHVHHLIININFIETKTISE